LGGKKEKISEKNASEKKIESIQLFYCAL